MDVERSRRRPARAAAVRRRRAALAVALAAAVGGGALAVHAATGGGGSSTADPSARAASTGKAGKARRRRRAATTAAATAPARRVDLAHPLGPIPKAMPGTAQVVTAGPATAKGAALTFDDGYCTDCVGRLVAGVEATGAHVTFCPNGTYGSVWERYATRIRRLIARGQVTICNHTWDHPDLKTRSRAQIADEITRNELWIERTFGVTGRPWFRPPYGSYDADVLAVAGQLGYTRILLWSGTTADSTARDPAYVESAVRYWAKPGAIILAHGNHPGTATAFPVLVRILARKGLATLTAAELLAHGGVGGSATGYGG